ncbi:hypothetical protein LDENG_00104080 [Lucifuga dentata]|nr:hypothetical protein LDENG_00104080 [Lucifuga dentata]
MAQSQFLYILAACDIFLTYPVCGVLVMLTNLTTEISPCTLVVMSLERYITVCFPMRHAAIITVRNTGVAIITIWAFNILNVLTQVVLMLKFPFGDLESLQMSGGCSKSNMMFYPISYHYDRGFAGFLFVSATVIIILSYVDKASARKARNTLLLQMVQLGLSLSSTMFNIFLKALSKVLNRLVFSYMRSVLYVFMFMFPRCLSGLIYGLRDQTIRSILMYYLCCRPKRSVIPAKAEVSS